MSDPGEPTTDAATGSDSQWHLAVFCYVLAYNIGTIVWGLAEPTTSGLLVGGVGVGAVVWATEKSGRCPPAVVNLGMVMILPIVVAAIVIATPLNE
ncbi:MAG: hypothetical protein ACRDO7_07755 [Nocardioidaceae bacterium]